MKIFSLTDLEAIEAQADATLMFHGTSSCYSETIEARGWRLGWRPFRWEDMEFLLDLSEGVRLNHTESVYLEVNLEAQRKCEDRGSYFTYLLEGAVQYAENTGGETIRCAVSRIKALLHHLRDTDGYAPEKTRLAALLNAWRPLIDNSFPVIYLVRGSEITFPDVLPTQIGAFAWQLSQWGEIRFKKGEFRSRADVPPEDILGKATLRGRPTPT